MRPPFDRKREIGVKDWYMHKWHGDLSNYTSLMEDLCPSQNCFRISFFLIAHCDPTVDDDDQGTS